MTNLTDLGRHEYCKATPRTRVPIKAAQPICYNDTRQSSSIVFVPHSVTIWAFCNGNQRSALKTHWQLSAHCLRSRISKDSYGAAVMSPKLEMSAVEQRLFSISVSFPRTARAVFLITLQPSRPAIPSAHLTGLPALQAPTFFFFFFPYSLFDVFSRNRCTRSAGEKCDRILPLLLHCLLCD